MHTFLDKVASPGFELRTLKTFWFALLVPSGLVRVLEFLSMISWLLSITLTTEQPIMMGDGLLELLHYLWGRIQHNLMHLYVETIICIIVGGVSSSSSQNVFLLQGYFCSSLLFSPTSPTVNFVT